MPYYTTQVPTPIRCWYPSRQAQESLGPVPPSSTPHGPLFYPTPSPKPGDLRSLGGRAHTARTDLICCLASHWFAKRRVIFTTPSASSHSKTPHRSALYIEIYGRTTLQYHLWPHSFPHACSSNGSNSIPLRNTLFIQIVKTQRPSCPPSLSPLPGVIQANSYFIPSASLIQSPKMTQLPISKEYTVFTRFALNNIPPTKTHLLTTGFVSQNFTIFIFIFLPSLYAKFLLDMLGRY